MFSEWEVWLKANIRKITVNGKVRGKIFESP